MSVKKAFQPLIDFLQANADEVISDVMPKILEFTSAKGAGGVATTVHRNEEGEITHVRCSYFKAWMPLSHVEFGAKAGSASGLNSMCKEGVSFWTKQQRDFRKAKEALLDQVSAGDIAPDQIQAELESLEVARTMIHTHSADMAWAELEDALVQSTEDLDAMFEASLPEEATEETEA